MMDAEQKAAFLSARCGYLTASNMAAAMGKGKRGENSPAARNNLLRSLLAERLTGLNVRRYVTPAMEDGIQYEDEAADKWVELTGRDLRPSRIYTHPTIEYFSATPDRELDDGLVEIKVPTVETFIGWKLDDVVPSEHMPQMAAQCLCTGKRWVGFLAYSPHIKDEGKRLFMKRYEPPSAYLDEVQAAAERFLSELDSLWEQFTTGDVLVA